MCKGFRFLRRFFNSWFLSFYLHKFTKVLSMTQRSFIEIVYPSSSSDLEITGYPWMMRFLGPEKIRAIQNHTLKYCSKIWPKTTLFKDYRLVIQRIGTTWKTAFFETTLIKTTLFKDFLYTFSTCSLLGLKCWAKIVIEFQQ